MSIKSFGVLLAISIATSLIAPLTLVAAKPVGPNPVEGGKIMEKREIGVKSFGEPD